MSQQWYPQQPFASRPSPPGSPDRASGIVAAGSLVFGALSVLVLLAHLTFLYAISGRSLTGSGPRADLGGFVLHHSTWTIGWGAAVVRFIPGAITLALAVAALRPRESRTGLPLTAAVVAGLTSGGALIGLICSLISELAVRAGAGQ